MPVVYIVIVNWNAWSDTLECLESLFRIEYSNFRIVICDNDSQDGSPDKIRAWASGLLPAPETKSALSCLTSPAVVKPVSFAEYSRSQIDEGKANDPEVKLTLINTGGNLGFAGGNNVGIRYALKNGADFVWLLNNDTVVSPDALTRLVERACDDKEIGIVGSSLRFYDEPNRLQALGGATFVPWLCKARPIEIGSPFTVISDELHREVEAKTAYVIGASMLVSRKFIEDIGYLCEDYFLYYEELDWACRAIGKYKLAFAPGSHVFHKVGATAGNGSIFSLGYMFRSRLRFMKKFYPHLLLLTRFWLLLDGVKAVLKGRLQEGLLAASVAFSASDK